MVFSALSMRYYEILPDANDFKYGFYSLTLGYKYNPTISFTVKKMKLKTGSAKTASVITDWQRAFHPTHAHIFY